MRIGILGAGQLGQMLGFAARELGDECRFLDPSDAPPAAEAGEVLCAAYDDAGALADLAATSDVISYEFENVPVAALRDVSSNVPVYPPLDALASAQDRLVEKRLFETLEIPVPPYRRIDDRDGLQSAVSDLGLPLVVKTRRFGYDGKGQAVIRSDSDLEAAWAVCNGRAAIAEAWVAFDAEVSVIGARGIDGDVAIWPLTQNVHTGGILRTSCAPAPQQGLTSLAEDYVRRLLEHFDYVGVLALELFVVGDRLLANEFAPRVHNSGHWTIEGAVTSQFGNHVRAITGRPLGATDAKGHAGMFNLIGEIPEALCQSRAPRLWLHDYGKAPRSGRKLGHVTVLADSPEDRDAKLAALAKL